MKTDSRLRIGTRASLLARIQTDEVTRALDRAGVELDIEVVVIRTLGDARVDQRALRIGGKGIFTSELEDALLAGRIDLAVHSLKDLPTDFHEGLALAAIPARQDPRDVLVGGPLAPGAEQSGRITIGTGSIRRAAQLRRLAPHAEVVDLRGNLDTRLGKVSDRVVDRAILARAGLCRMKRDDRISMIFEPDDILPAPGQGALGLQIRRDDRRVRELLDRIHCHAADRCVTAERAFLKRLGGGCHVPAAALATIDGQNLTLKGRVISPDGTIMVQHVQSGPHAAADLIGRQLADTLIEKGADRIIDLAKGERRRGSENGS